jgi:hypothetical protein
VTYRFRQHDAYEEHRAGSVAAAGGDLRLYVILKEIVQMKIRGKSSRLVQISQEDLIIADNSFFSEGVLDYGMNSNLSIVQASVPGQEETQIILQDTRSSAKKKLPQSAKDRPSADDTN